MQLIDTHCHLDFPQFDADRDAVIARAKEIGLIRLINVGSTLEGSRRSVALAQRYDMIHAVVGIHPHEASSVTDSAVSEIRALAKESKVVAIGEVGLDHYRDLAPRDLQAEAFRKFIRLSIECKLPIVIHSREAARETLDILKEETGGSVRGVMHCFSGGTGTLKECLDLGMHISFTCNLTYKNAHHLRDAAKLVPQDRLLIETDAPYLAPEAHRGKRNESSYLTFLVDELASLHKLTPEDIGRITTHNADTLFHLGLEAGAKIAYEIRNSLYLNITNRCTNACGFCVRNTTAFVKGHNLRLDYEPSVQELLAAIGDAARYDEIVFCGFGEPTVRLDAVKAISSAVKKAGVKVRLVTNGHGDLINGFSVARELTGLVDRVSVSLNAQDAKVYEAVCKPEFGADTYQHVIGFIKACVSAGIAVEATCVDAEGVDVNRCRSIAESLGATFRPRHLGVVG